MIQYKKYNLYTFRSVDLLSQILMTSTTDTQRIDIKFSDGQDYYLVSNSWDVSDLKHYIEILGKGDSSHFQLFNISDNVLTKVNDTDRLTKYDSSFFLLLNSQEERDVQFLCNGKISHAQVTDTTPIATLVKTISKNIISNNHEYKMTYVDRNTGKLIGINNNDNTPLGAILNFSGIPTIVLSCSDEIIVKCIVREKNYIIPACLDTSVPEIMKEMYNIYCINLKNNIIFTKKGNEKRNITGSTRTISHLFENNYISDPCICFS